jgi:hypothetical protein
MAKSSTPPGTSTISVTIPFFLPYFPAVITLVPAQGAFT